MLEKPLLHWSYESWFTPKEMLSSGIFLATSLSFALDRSDTARWKHRVIVAEARRLSKVRRLPR